MKIISKRQAMAIYRQHPQSRGYFPSARVNTHGPAVSATTLVVRSRISAECSRSSRSVAWTAMARMSYCVASR